MPATAEAPPVPFEELCRLLRHQGFVLGVDQYVRAQELIGRIGGEVTPGELRSLLCPLFAKSPAQQQLFTNVFDGLYRLAQAQPETNATKSEAPAGATLNSIAAATGSLRKQMWLGALLVLLLAGLLLVLLWPEPPAQPDQATRPPTVTPSGPAPVTQLPENVVSVPARIVSGFPPVPEHLIYRLPATWVLILTPWALFGLAEAFRWARSKRAIEALEKQARPPYTWPLRVAEPVVLKPLESGQFYRLARSMRRRIAGPSRWLDVRRTIEATWRKLGYFTPRYRPSTRPPEYLVLIERKSRGDLLARWYLELARGLRREQVYCEIYLYDRDPRMLERAEDSAPASLIQLARRFPLHRVLIFGSLAGWCDPLTGRPADWLEGEEVWPMQALLSLERPDERLARSFETAGFVLAPATIEGLDRLLGGPQEERLGTGATWSQAIVPPPTLGLAGVSMPDLEAFLGLDLFHWLAAASVYPQLNWELLFALAALPALPEDLGSEQNLLRLASLEWLREGEIPRATRRELVARLPQPLLDAAKERIIRTLEKAEPPPEGSHAAFERDLEIALHRSGSPETVNAGAVAGLSRLQALPRHLLTRDALFADLVGRESAAAVTGAVPGPDRLTLMGPVLIVLSEIVVGIGIAWSDFLSDAVLIPFAAVLCFAPLWHFYVLRRFRRQWRQPGVTLTGLYRRYMGLLPCFLFPREIRRSLPSTQQVFGWVSVVSYLVLLAFALVGFYVLNSLRVFQFDNSTSIQESLKTIVPFLLLLGSIILQVRQAVEFAQETRARVGHRSNPPGLAWWRWRGLGSAASAALATGCLIAALPFPSLQHAALPLWRGADYGTVLIRADGPVAAGLTAQLQEPGQFFDLFDLFGPPDLSYQTSIIGPEVRVTGIFHEQGQVKSYDLQFLKAGSFARDPTRVEVGGPAEPVIQIPKEYVLQPQPTQAVELPPVSATDGRPTPNRRSPVRGTDGNQSRQVTPSPEPDAAAPNAAAPIADPAQQLPNPNVSPRQQAPQQQSPAQQQAPQAALDPNPPKPEDPQAATVLDLGTVPYVQAGEGYVIGVAAEQEIRSYFIQAKEALERQPGYVLYISVGQAGTDISEGLTQRIAGEIRDRFIKETGVSPSRVVARGLGLTYPRHAISFRLEMPRKGR